LTVTDADGATDMYTATVTVSGIAPTAAFSAAPSQPKAGELVAFTDLSTDDGDVVTWHWDFGDGNASAAQNPSHEYKEAGTYTVTLTIWDDDGTKDTTTKTITVEGDNNTPGFMLPLLLLALAGVAIGLSRRRGKV
jgi:PKD repeat protein